MEQGVFISYRRSDSAAYAGRIADYFAHRHPEIPVFFDAGSIEPGEDFAASIERRLAETSVILAPIGATWLDATDPVHGGRRIDNPTDVVRRELATALARGVRIVPVLLDDARMPSESELPADVAALSRCNAQLMRHAAFARDVQHLAEFVADYLGRPSTSAPRPSTAAVHSRTRLVAAFETFAAEWAPGSWMVCEAPSGAVVQYLRSSLDGVVLDVPVVELDAERRRAVHRLVTDDLGGTDVHEVASQLSLPLQPSYLAHMTMLVFRRVWGEANDVPITVTFAAKSVEPVVTALGSVVDGRAEGADASEVRASLEAAFMTFCGSPTPCFMVCEQSTGGFVQFVRAADDDPVTLDLPIDPLSPRQLLAAERELEVARRARRTESGDDGTSSFQLDLAPDPSSLADLTLEVFELVHGSRPTSPLTIEIGRW